jgi:putative oxygen-independent coproporphyrinogen III oxidase
MLIYVHVPFCRSKCRYCAFYSEAPAPGAFEAYAEALLREIDLRAGKLGSRQVETIFFGGGTPSLLPVPLLGRTLEALAARFAFAPHATGGEGLEISLEANPESLTVPGRAADLKALGITRLSIGAQSFDEARLRLIGRPHTAAGAEKAIHAAQQAGFDNIGLDLIRGLPGSGRLAAHTRASWLRELHRAVMLAPQHISTYCLTLEPGTPLAQAADTLRFPTEATQTAMYHEGAAFLESEGFPQYEVSNFARPGFTCRHNQGYWRGVDYLGLGPGAVSTLDGIRRANPPDFGLWRAACLNGDASGETETLGCETLALERLMLGLRTVEGVDIPVWEALSGRSFATTHGTLAHALEVAGMVIISADRLAPTRQGLAVADAIVERFVR